VSPWQIADPMCRYSPAKIEEQRPIVKISIVQHAEVATKSIEKSDVISGNGFSHPAYSMAVSVRFVVGQIMGISNEGNPLALKALFVGRPNPLLMLNHRCVSFDHSVCLRQGSLHEHRTIRYEARPEGFAPTFGGLAGSRDSVVLRWLHKIAHKEGRGYRASSA
jgi:hypothetical protein